MRNKTRLLTFLGVFFFLALPISIFAQHDKTQAGVLSTYEQLYQKLVGGATLRSGDAAP